MEKESVISLLRKLMAQADGEKAVGNLAAAEAFAAKAQELLLKHKLEMSDVEIAAEEMNEPVLGEVICADEMMDAKYNYNRQKSDIWVSTLLNACAKANFCKVLTHRGGKNMMTIVGRASDRAAASALFVYLSKACIEMAPREADMNGAYEKIERRTWISSFKLGYANAIYHRLDSKRDQLKAGLALQSNSTALTRIDQMEKAVEEKFEELFPDTVKAGGGRASNRSGYHAGGAYGSRIGINGTKRLGGQVSAGAAGGRINIFGR
jgi:hypothetical protein